MFKLFVVIFALCLIKDAFPVPIKEDRCLHPMDIAFILDASTDDYVTQNVWKTMLALAEKIVDRLGASVDGNHYAVMTFSENPHIEMEFKKLNEMDYSSNKTNSVIGGLKRQVNYTFIDRALLAADTQLFTRDAGMRLKARKVAFVITDGIQTMDQGPFTPLVNATEGLKSKGVEIYTIGVGYDMDVMALINIASSENNVFAEWYISIMFEEFIKSFCGIPSKGH